MIKRDAAPSLSLLAKHYSAISVYGPRQSGKTTLCKSVFPEHEYINLEASDQRAYATEDPREFLSQFSGGVILDEVQNAPELLGYIQEEVDRERCPGRFVLTGSQHFALSEKISQSLAGRVGLLQLLPPSYKELQRFADCPSNLLEVLWTGSYPRILDEAIPPRQWLRDYFSTYVQRDVRQLVNVTSLSAFTSFAGLLAGRTACELNLSSLGADAGVSHPTAQSWLSVLETSMIVTRVSAFHSNIRKRFVKAPKIHFVDSGLACYLLGIRTPEELQLHPLRGAIFESWVASELTKIRCHQNEEIRLSHLRLDRGLEMDLMVNDGQLLRSIEVKSGSTIKSGFLNGLTRVQELLEEDARELQSYLVYGGSEKQKRNNCTIVPWSSVEDCLS